MSTRDKEHKPLTVQQTMTLARLMDRFKTEGDCKTYLKAARWSNGVVRCPRCCNDKVYVLKQPWKWQCQKCAKKGYRFSITTGTVFENTKYPLRAWFEVCYLMSQSKKGISALQIHRQIGSGDYRTAWFMCHRIRAAMQGDVLPLTGEVEVDETFLGGKYKNKHRNQKPRGAKGPHGSGKIPVIGAIARKGNVICQMIERTDTKTLDAFVRKSVDKKVSLLATDEAYGYRKLGDEYPHGIVKHSENQYVVGAIHTNSIESFWSLLKRGIVGTYHKVSREHLPLYLNEFSFRFNERNNPDIFDAILSRV